MAFGITGFGGSQTTPSPQIFQALSLGGSPPRPPAPPYGTPNQNLVPVAKSGSPALPANLTLAAHATFQAILKLSGPEGVAAVSNQALPPKANTTTSVSATNPGVQLQIQGPVPGGIPVIGNPPAGPVSFALTAPPASLTSGLNALAQSIASLHQAEQTASAQQQYAAQQQPQQQTPASGSPQAGSPQGAQPQAAPAPPAPAQSASVSSGASTPAPASAGFVAKIVQTVQNLAVAAVYPAPIFSFSA